MKNILLTEDDPFIADIYSTSLKNAGFEISLAADGEECLKKLKEKNFDLILLDLLMPKIDGLTVLKHIKEDLKSKDTPVMILTNIGEKENIEKGIQLGAVDYLIKTNFSPEEIIQKIEKLLYAKENI